MPGPGLGTPDKLFLYQMVQSNQAKTNQGDFCRRASCSHPRKDHADGSGGCTYALVCRCDEHVPG